MNTDTTIKKIIDSDKSDKAYSEVGKNLVFFIDKNELKTAKVIFKISKNGKGNLIENIRLGVKDTKELVKLFDFFGLYGITVQIKTIETMSSVFSTVKDYPNFYLISLNQNIN